MRVSVIGVCLLCHGHPLLVEERSSGEKKDVYYSCLPAKIHFNLVDVHINHVMSFDLLHFLLSANHTDTSKRAC